MTNREQIPQSPVPLTPVAWKRISLTLSGAIPVELPPETVEWWNLNTESNTSIQFLGEAVKDLVHRPPTLGNKWYIWQRFYTVMMGCAETFPKTPKALGDNTALGNRLAEDILVIGPSSEYLDLFPECVKRFPFLFDGRSVSEPYFTFNRMKGSGTVRTRPWYLIQYSIRDCPGDMEKEALTFAELLVSQLFNYWIGKPLLPFPLYALGSRTSDGQVPGIHWVKGVIHFCTIDRKEVGKYPWRSLTIPLEC